MFADTKRRRTLGIGRSHALIGSIRRDCLDHVVVFGERHLRYLPGSYQRYYNHARTHLSLNKDAPVSRAVQAVGRVVPNPYLGGLHHQRSDLISGRDRTCRSPRDLATLERSGRRHAKQLVCRSVEAASFVNATRKCSPHDLRSLSEITWKSAWWRVRRSSSVIERVCAIEVATASGS